MSMFFLVLPFFILFFCCRNLKNATIRRLLQLANHSPAAAPAPASLHNGRHRKRNKTNIDIRTPSAGPSSSSVPPENSHTSSRLPFLHPTHAPVVSPSASAPSITLPSSPSSHHAPAPAPVIEPPTSVPHNQHKSDLAPSPVFILIPPPIISPAAAANTHKKHARLWVLSSIAGAVSFLLAISAVYLLCWRANKVVTIRPWATGLSGQLQKAFVTGSSFILSVCCYLCFIYIFPTQTQNIAQTCRRTCT